MVLVWLRPMRFALAMMPLVPPESGLMFSGIVSPQVDRIGPRSEAPTLWSAQKYEKAPPVPTVYGGVEEKKYGLPNVAPLMSPKCKLRTCQVP